MVSSYWTRHQTIKHRTCYSGARSEGLNHSDSFLVILTIPISKVFWKSRNWLKVRHDIPFGNSAEASDIIIIVVSSYWTRHWTQELATLEPGSKGLNWWLILGYTVYTNRQGKLNNCLRCQNVSFSNSVENTDIMIMCTLCHALLFIPCSATGALVWTELTVCDIVNEQQCVRVCIVPAGQVIALLMSQSSHMTPGEALPPSHTHKCLQVMMYATIGGQPKIIRR